MPSAIQPVLASSVAVGAQLCPVLMLPPRGGCTRAAGLHALHCAGFACSLPALAANVVFDPATAGWQVLGEAAAVLLLLTDNAWRARIPGELPS